MVAGVRATRWGFLSWVKPQPPLVILGETAGWLVFPVLISAAGFGIWAQHRQLGTPLRFLLLLARRADCGCAVDFSYADSNANATLRPRQLHRTVRPQWNWRRFVEARLGADRCQPIDSVSRTRPGSC